MHKILIVDDEEDIRDILEIILDSEFDLNITTAESGKHAINYLTQHNDFDLIISDYSMPNGSGGELYTFNKNNQNLPFILVTGGQIDDFEEMHDLKTSNALNANLSKPLKEDMFIKFVQAALFNNKKIAPKTSQSIEHIKIKIDYISKHLSVNYNTYIKLPSGKMIKIFTEGDEVDMARLSAYKDKNENYVYLHRDDFKKLYQSTLKNLFTRVSKSANAKMALGAAGEVLEYAGDTLNELGVSETQTELLTKATDNCIKQLKSDDSISSHLKAFMRDKGYLISHSITTLHIAHMITKHMNYSSDAVIDKLSYASMLHDVVLSGTNLSEIKYAGSEEFQKLSKEDQKIVLEHPVKTMELVDKMKKVPSDINHIIYEHHERPNNNGFPRKLSSSKIAPLSCVFILSLEVADYFYYHKVRPDTLEVLKKFLIENFDTGNFKIPLKALIENILVI